MQLILNLLISSVLQFLLINLIPFLWWMLSGRKKGTSYFKWLGVKTVEKRCISPTMTAILIGLICFGTLSIAILFILRDVETAVSQFEGLGFAGIVPALVYAFAQTSLTEEIFFRGFLLKRFASRLRFIAANFIQSALFGLMHGVMFFSLTSVQNAVLITLFTAFIGFYMGFINEKKADGSILPSWCVHGAANMLSACVSMFSII